MPPRPSLRPRLTRGLELEPQSEAGRQQEVGRLQEVGPPADEEAVEQTGGAGLPTAAAVARTAAAAAVAPAAS